MMIRSKLSYKPNKKVGVQIFLLTIAVMACQAEGPDSEIRQFRAPVEKKAEFTDLIVGDITLEPTKVTLEKTRIVFVLSSDPRLGKLLFRIRSIGLEGDVFGDKEDCIGTYIYIKNNKGQQNSIKLSHNSTSFRFDSLFSFDKKTEGYRLSYFKYKVSGGGEWISYNYEHGSKGEKNAFTGVDSDAGKHIISTYFDSETKICEQESSSNSGSETPKPI